MQEEADDTGHLILKLNGKRQMTSLVWLPWAGQNLGLGIPHLLYWCHLGGGLFTGKHLVIC